MNCDNLRKLISKAREMALGNRWEENAYKVNMKILEMDNNNSAACTRLAKYYKLNNNLTDAKKMYLKALEIDPNNHGARNNLEDIEKHQQEKIFIDQITTSRESYDAGRNLAQKGKYGLSIKCFLKAYSIEPLLKYALGLAKTYKKSGKHDEVKKLYKQLVDGNPSQNDIDVINVEFAILLQR